MATMNIEQNPYKYKGYFSQLKPNSWKSDSHLNKKQVNRAQTDCDPKEKNVVTVTRLSKSSDWTNVPLEVPNRDDLVHLQNPNLSNIFDNGKITPEPPPRKHKKGIREKIESVAKNSLQALQSKKSSVEPKPIVEPLCVKKYITPTCPIDNHFCAIHKKIHSNEEKNNAINDKQNENRATGQEVKTSKGDKRKKNLSVVSLPNYSELKLAIATFDEIDKKEQRKENNSDNSIIPLVGETKKSHHTNGKSDTSMTRCRSFGSLLPHQLLDRWRLRKIPTDNESDDSFSALEDWDLRLLEHYNPKDASLPRPRKLPQNNPELLANIENMIVKDEIEIPVAPVRKSESLIKKINREASEVAKNSPTSINNRCKSVTPPPSPISVEILNTQNPIKLETKTDHNEKSTEHSTLMKILEKYSNEDNVSNSESDIPYIDGPEMMKLSKQLQREIESIEGFLINEKLNISRDLNSKIKNKV